MCAENKNSCFTSSAWSLHFDPQLKIFQYRLARRTCHSLSIDRCRSTHFVVALPDSSKLVHNTTSRSSAVAHNTQTKRIL